MYKRLCFINCSTIGLHQTNLPVDKKHLFCFARLVNLTYDIGHFEGNQYITETKKSMIAKPRCMTIPEDTVKYHGITQEKALKKGIDPEQIIIKFLEDIKGVDIIVSHNINFHLKTIIAEAVRYNILIDFNKYIIVDTIDFNHNYGFLKLKDLAEKLKIKDINETDNLDLVVIIFKKLYNKHEKLINVK